MGENNNQKFKEQLNQKNVGAKGLRPDQLDLIPRKNE